MKASENLHQEFVEGETFEAEEKASKADQKEKLFFKALMERVEELKELSFLQAL